MTNQRQSYAVQELLKTLKNFSAYGQLPIEMQVEVKKLKESLSKYKEQEERPIVELLEGQLLTQEELLKIVIDASENNNWKITENTLSKVEQFNVKEKFKVDSSEVKEFDISRNGSGTYRLLITVFPGCVSVMLDNGKVGYYLDDLISNAKLKKMLSVNLEY